MYSVPAAHCECESCSEKTQYRQAHSVRVEIDSASSFRSSSQNKASPHSRSGEDQSSISRRARGRSRERDEFFEMDDLDIDDCPEPIEPDHETSWASASNYSPWEEECLREVEDCGDLESQMATEKDLSSRRVWLSFQNAACNIAQLYKDRHRQGDQGVSLWVPFQNAASSVTTLYRDCMESQKRIIELGIQSGQQRRNKEILAWLKKRKRNHVRRDELIAFLCGKSGKSLHHNHHLVRNNSSSWTVSAPRQRGLPGLASDVSTGSAAMSAPSSSPGLHSTRSSALHNITTLTCLSLSDAPSLSNCDATGGDLQTFRDALAFSAAGIRTSAQATPSNPLARRNSSARGSATANGAILNGASSLDELNAFITEEFTRHVEAKKRSAMSSDVTMDSPTHKKPKLF